MRKSERRFSVVRCVDQQGSFETGTHLCPRGGVNPVDNVQNRKKTTAIPGGIHLSLNDARAIYVNRVFRLTCIS